MNEYGRVQSILGETDPLEVCWRLQHQNPDPHVDKSQ
jgi:hypothetical protein